MEQSKPKDFIYQHKQTIGHRFAWTVGSLQPITEEDAKHWQASQGYAVMGYGFEGFKTWQEHRPGPPYYTAIWYCSRTCD